MSDDAKARVWANIQRRLGVGREVGDWICGYCGGANWHDPARKAPRGVCGRCRQPIDLHTGVDTPAQKCPEKVPA